MYITYISITELDNINARFVHSAVSESFKDIPLLFFAETRFRQLLVDNFIEEGAVQPSLTYYNLIPYVRSVRGSFDLIYPVAVPVYEY